MYKWGFFWLKNKNHSILSFFNSFLTFFVSLSCAACLVHNEKKNSYYTTWKLLMAHIIQALFLLFLACTVIWVLDPAKYTTYIYNTTTVFSHCVGLRHVKHPITIESVVRIPPKQRGSTCLVKQVLSILTLLRKRWRTQTGPRPSWAKSPKINTF